jgi:hypothetical protein
MHARVVADDHEVVAHCGPAYASVLVALFAPKFSPEMVTDIPVLVAELGPGRPKVNETIGESKVKYLVDVPTIVLTVWIRGNDPGYDDTAPGPHVTIVFVDQDVVAQSTS